MAEAGGGAGGEISAQEIVVKLRADIEKYVAGIEEAKNVTKDFDDEVKTVSDKSLPRMSRSARDVVFTMFAIRGAFSLARQILKEFGIENENLAKAMHYVELAAYAGAIASKIYSAAKMWESKVTKDNAIAHMFEGAGKLMAKTLLFATPIALAIVAGAIAAMYLASPRAEFGGVVPARAGGTNVLIGEAGRAEAILPLDAGMRGLGIGHGDISITIQRVETNDPERFVDMLGRKIQQLKTAGY